MLNADGTPDDENTTQRAIAQGNILFLLSNSTEMRNKADTTDEFNLMPYLSENGDQNVFILNVSRYVRLNKRLGEKGNEQQLEDESHVMEVSDTLNIGYTAPFICSGWGNIFAPLDEIMISYVKGEMSSDDVIAAMDASQSLILDSSIPHYTTVTETPDTEDCAELVGICFPQATSADVALISGNTWVFDTEAFELNTEGVTGSLFSLPVTDEEIVSILPTGWRITFRPCRSPAHASRNWLKPVTITRTTAPTSPTCS